MIVNNSARPQVLDNNNQPKNGSGPQLDKYKSSTNKDDAFNAYKRDSSNVEGECEFRGDWYKRPLDLSVLIVTHVLLAPLWLIFWIIIPVSIWLEDRGSPFYRQTRVGKNGRLFKVIKFRTMIKNAERSTGPVLAVNDDRRITRVGKVLRKTRLDEIPQVLNVWTGDMSLVGPRPERPELVDKVIQEIPEFNTRLLVRPGIAGLAQVRGDYSTPPRNKLRYDELYIRHLSPALDIKLLIQSLLVALGVLKPSYRHRGNGKKGRNWWE